MKEILIKTAECKVNYGNKLLAKHSVESSRGLSLVNNLLKGLLAPSPEERLSAKQALRLPVFDKFRGTQLPELSSPEKGYKNFGDEDTDVFDEGSPVMHSIKSLEGRSIIMKKPMEGKSTGTSIAHSMRWEGESQAEKSPDFNKKPIPRKLASGILGEPSGLLPRQESFDTESKFSADGKLSPLGSPSPAKKIGFPRPIGTDQSKFLTPQMQPRQISLFGESQALASFGQKKN